MSLRTPRSKRTDTLFPNTSLFRSERLACTEHGAQVVTLDITRPIDEAIAPITDAGGSDATVLPSLTGDDLATILFTSGSTGQSKGAWSRHRAVVQAIFNYVTQTEIGRAHV